MTEQQQKTIRLLISMSLDMLGDKLTIETYISNLEFMLEELKKYK